MPSKAGSGQARLSANVPHASPAFELEVPGEWRFRSTRTEVAAVSSCAKVLAAAGLTGSSATGGGYKLRNAFALRQLMETSNMDAKLADLMGIAESEMVR